MWLENAGYKFVHWKESTKARTQKPVPKLAPFAVTPVPAINANTGSNITNTYNHYSDQELRYHLFNVTDKVSHSLLHSPPPSYLVNHVLLVLENQTVRVTEAEAWTTLTSPNSPWTSVSKRSDHPPPPIDVVSIEQYDP